MPHMTAPYAVGVQYRLTDSSQLWRVLMVLDDEQGYFVMATAGRDMFLTGWVPVDGLEITNMVRFENRAVAYADMAARFQMLAAFTPQMAMVGW